MLVRLFVDPDAYRSHESSLTEAKPIDFGVSMFEGLFRIYRVYAYRIPALYVHT